MDVSSAVINSLTASGAAGGELVIQSGKSLEITGDFESVSSPYTLTLESGSELSITDGGSLIYTNTTMETATAYAPSSLSVDYEVSGGALVVNAYCTLEAVISEVDDWTIDGGTVQLGRQVASDEGAMSIIVANDGTLDVGGVPFTGEFFPSAYEAELVYGPGDNVVEAGNPDAEATHGWEFEELTRIRPGEGADTLTLVMKAELYIASWFGDFYGLGPYVREAWDTRAVDIVAEPLRYGEPATQSIELISTDLGSYYPSDPVVFADVPCLGAWRDLDIVATTLLGVHPTVAADWHDNSFTDQEDREEETPDIGGIEAGYYRDVTVGTGREYRFYEGNRVYYYGTRTLDGDVYYWGESLMEVTEYTRPSLDDLITFAVETIYGDWNGDCEITNAELQDLEDVIEYGPYNPLMNYDCDGELTNQVEGAVALANFRTQPDCGEEDAGGGGESAEDDVDVEGLAAWIADVLSEAELEEFVAGLTVATEEFEGTRVGEDMADLLSYLE